ncbi:MAG TPA: hypothetical protein VL132_01800, partial [Planctomycetaceae bacterium]|nr:hypothetical protein [Planctomycetaceae bacterium]
MDALSVGGFRRLIAPRRRDLHEARQKIDHQVRQFRLLAREVVPFGNQLRRQRPIRPTTPIEVGCAFEACFLEGAQQLELRQLWKAFAGRTGLLRGIVAGPGLAATGGLSLPGRFLAVGQNLEQLLKTNQDPLLPG